LSIYKVTGDGVPGHKLGDELSEAETLTFKSSPYADLITVFPDAARGRLNMQDAAPSKPVGSVPHTNARAYHPDLAVGALSEQTPVAMGEAMHANPAIRQPSLNERLRDANPAYQLDPATILSARPAPAAEEKGGPKLAAYPNEAPVLGTDKVQQTAEALAAKGPEGPSKGLAAAGPGPVLNDAPVAQEKAPDAAKVI
jgi:hypothetical protein